MRAPGCRRTYNLDRKNPNAAETLEHLPPEQLVAEIVAKERRILELMAEIEAELRGGVG
jgi:type I restriction enzyme M protein